MNCNRKYREGKNCKEDSAKYFHSEFSHVRLSFLSTFSERMLS